MLRKIIFTTFICLLSFSTYAQYNRSDNIVGSTVSIQSKILEEEREIQIFLPDDYENSNKKYPVLYILDGQRYFLHGVSLQKSFVEFKQTPKFIIVGISKNPSDRNRNYSVNATNYRNFIASEVTEYIDQTFRTSEKRMLFGWAYGGGFVVETMMTEPNLFEMYIAASPFPLNEKIDKMDSLITNNPDFDKSLFFTSGTNEGSVKEGTTKLNSLLKNKAPKTMDWTFRELEGEEHRSTPFVTLYHGIKNYFKYYPELQYSNLTSFLNAGGLDYVYEYYQERATRFGFSKELSDWTMFSLTRNAIRANDFKQFETLMKEFEKTRFIERLRVSRSCLIAEFYLKNEQYNQAINLFKLIEQNHPNTARPLNGLGTGYTKLGQLKEASEYFEKAKKTN